MAPDAGDDDTWTATPSEVATGRAPGGAVPAPIGELGPGTRVGRHVLEALLGLGGMGIVYRARDPQLDRAVAVKVVRSSSSTARLLREAQAMARLRHPNVIPIFDVGTLGDDVFVVMPLLEGGTLGAWLRDQPRSWMATLDHFVAAGRGLAAAHAAGMVHRDFKPDNVLLGGDGEIQVADFGLARLDRDLSGPPSGPPSGESPAAPVTLDLTRTGDLLGTPAYMAPEQLRGEVSDGRGDQFSFCVALWEGLFGARPFSPGGVGGPAALTALLEAIDAGRLTTPAPGREAPAWLRAIVLRGLRARPAERWPSMTALLDAIAAHRGGRRGRTVISVAVAAAVVAGVVAALVELRGGDRPRGSVASEVAPAPVVVSYRRERITQRGDVFLARLSPDGTRLALAGSDGIIMRSVEPGGGDETLVALDDGSPVMALSWSPRGDRLAVAYGAGAHRRSDGNVEIIDVRSRTVERLSLHANTLAFASDTTLATARVSRRAVQVSTLPSLRVVSECAIPGRFAWLTTLDLVDGGDAMLIGIVDMERRPAIQVVGRDCKPGALIARTGGIDSHAVSSDGRSVWVRDEGTGSNQIVELGFDGVEVSRAKLGGGEDLQLVGEHQGRHFHIMRSTRATVETVTAAGARQVALSSDSDLRVDVTADGSAVAWIERPDRGAGALRIASLDRIAERSPPIMTGAVELAWSPDGRRLAVAVDDEQGVGLVVVDRAGAATTRWPRGDLGARNRPVWLDQHRIAAETSDYRRLAWLDADTGAAGQFVEPAFESVFAPRRSPRDGTIAFLGNPVGGGFGVWTMQPGASPVRVGASSDATPIWSPAGQLLTYHGLTGVISRVRDTGQRVEMQRVALLPQQMLTAVLPLPDGDLLLVLSRWHGDVTVSIPD